MDLWGRQARTPGEGESLVGVLRAGLQGAGGGQKTRAGETRVLRPARQSAVESTGRRKPGGYSTEQCGSPRGFQTGRAGESRGLGI